MGLFFIGFALFWFVLLNDLLVKFCVCIPVCLCGLNLGQLCVAPLMLQCVSPSAQWAHGHDVCLTILLFWVLACT